MTDNEMPDSGTPDVPGMDPSLAKFRQAFTTPQSRDWADEATTRLNHYLQVRHHAAASMEAGNQLVGDVEQFKQGLTSLVQNDPHAVHTALSLVDPSIGHLVGSMPNQPDNAGDHAQAIGDHIKSEIATAAVTSAAHRSAPVARGLLGEVKHLLPDGHADQLGTYIDLHEKARQRANAAGLAVQARDQRVSADAALHSYLSELADPATGQLQAPPHWNQRVLDDPALPPSHKVAADLIASRVQQAGDAKASDPGLISHIVSQAAQGTPMRFPDVLSHTGHRLTLADALHLSSFSQPMTPHAHADMRAFNGVLGQARNLLMGTDGEHGAAGAAAYGKFVNWLMPQVRNGANLNPQAKDYILGQGAIHSFLPTGDDLPKPAPKDRPTLAAIFGKART